MTLKREDFPDLTDEQWAAIQAEGDRRATDATKTAKKGLLTQAEVEAQVAERVAEERQRIEATEAEKLEIDRKAFEAREAAFKADQRKFTAKSKLLEGGIPADKVESLLPLFAGVDDKALDAAITTFVTTTKETIDAQVDKEKQNLLGNATPPADGTKAPVGQDEQIAQAYTEGNVEVGLDLALAQAGYTPPAQ
jgi:hypothetical protein